MSWLIYGHLVTPMGTKLETRFYNHRKKMHLKAADRCFTLVICNVDKMGSIFCCFPAKCKQSKLSIFNTNLSLRLLGSKSSSPNVNATSSVASSDILWKQKIEIK